MTRQTAEPVITNAVFRRPDHSQKLYEIIRIFPGWEHSRTMPNGYHRHLFYELLWIKSGCTVQLADFTEYVVTADQLLFLPQHIIHQCKADQSAEGIILLFNEDFFSLDQAVALRHFLLFNPLVGPLLLTPTPTDAKALHNLVDVLLDESSEPTNFSQNLALQSLLYALLYQVEQIAQRLKGPQKIHSLTNLDIYSRFSVLLETYFRTHHSVGFYASALHLSPKQLARHIAISRPGSTPQQLIHGRLIMEAKRLLAYSTQSIKEIAFTIGLDDPAYFSRLFKQKTGISPDAFRSIWGEKS